ncbi:UPF0587 protein CG4646 [Leptinotarsa decemlineata]|uniref:UPF0587 protein CG4646 n=1 Tax=Leptinotarsa decemlineata TaxID=7539 RepID=UPI000C252AE7|nr:UPF0587 protein CG4646 [Leptinotarsa decemlineata]
MVKQQLQIKVTLEGIEELYTNHPDYTFLVKFKCINCGEISDKWHDVCESHTFPGRSGKYEVNFCAKCKLCSREGTVDIIAGSNGKYTNDNQGNFAPIVTFECRGFELIDFTPGTGWIAKVEESATIFKNVDLSDKEWVEYDEKSHQSVSVFLLESRFVPVK